MISLLPTQISGPESSSSIVFQLSGIQNESSLLLVLSPLPKYRGGWGDARWMISVFFIRRRTTLHMTTCWLKIFLQYQKIFNWDECMMNPQIIFNYDFSSTFSLWHHYLKHSASNRFPMQNLHIIFWDFHYTCDFMTDWWCNFAFFNYLFYTEIAENVDKFQNLENSLTASYKILWNSNGSKDIEIVPQNHQAMPPYTKTNLKNALNSIPS